MTLEPALSQPATARSRDFGYEAFDRWAKVTSGWGWSEVAAVATDNQGRV